MIANFFFFFSSKNKKHKQLTLLSFIHVLGSFFDNVGTFLKKSPLDSPLASSKTYGQLTHPRKPIAG